MDNYFERCANRIEKDWETMGRIPGYSKCAYAFGSLVVFENSTCFKGFEIPISEEESKKLYELVIKKRTIEYNKRKEETLKEL